MKVKKIREIVCLVGFQLGFILQRNLLKSNIGKFSGTFRFSHNEAPLGLGVLEELF